MFQYERQHEKEKTQELTQQLDKEFKDLQGAFKKSYVRPQSCLSSTNFRRVGVWVGICGKIKSLMH